MRTGEEIHCPHPPDQAFCQRRLFDAMLLSFKAIMALDAVTKKCKLVNKKLNLSTYRIFLYHLFKRVSIFSF